MSSASNMRRTSYRKQPEPRSGHALLTVEVSEEHNEKRWVCECGVPGIWEPNFSLYDNAVASGHDIHARGLGAR